MGDGTCKGHSAGAVAEHSKAECEGLPDGQLGIAGCQGLLCSMQKGPALARAALATADTACGRQQGKRREAAAGFPQCEARASAGAGRW